MPDTPVKWKGKVALVVILILLAGGGYLYYKYFGSQEAQNRWKRTAVTFLEGNYDVTYTDMNNVKVWKVRNGKVTSEPDKGYYFFWVGKKYVQTPIARTYIEQVD